MKKTIEKSLNDIKKVLHDLLKIVVSIARRKITRNIVVNLARQRGEK